MSLVAEKKNAKTVFGLLPNCLVKNKIKFVLQPCNCIAREKAGKKNCSENCIAIQFLYCREEGLSSLNCIAGIV